MYIVIILIYTYYVLIIVFILRFNKFFSSVNEIASFLIILKLVYPIKLLYLSSSLLNQRPLLLFSRIILYKKCLY